MRKTTRHIAVRGWLIAVLVFLPCTSTAQQETEKLPAALEQGQETAVESPAPQSEAPKPSAHQEPPAAPVQSERSAEPSCGPRCQASEKREQSDLEAQEVMAKAAYDLVVISWWQFVAGLIGIGLLLSTLWFARQSTKAAIAAAEAAQRSAEWVARVERPYLILAELEPQGFSHSLKNIDDDETTVIHVGCSVKNSGSRVGIVRSIAMKETTNLPTAPPAIETTDWNGKEAITPETTSSIAALVFMLTKKEAVRIIASERMLYIYGFIRYSDMHGTVRLSGFAFEYCPILSAKCPEGLFITCGPTPYWYDIEEKPKGQA